MANGKDGPEGSQFKPSSMMRMGQLISAGLTFPVAILIGLFMGQTLDGWLGTRFLRMVFLFLGIAAGFLSFYRSIKYWNDNR